MGRILTLPTPDGSNTRHDRIAWANQSGKKRSQPAPYGTRRPIPVLWRGYWASTVQSFGAVGMFGIALLIAGPLGRWTYDAFSPGAVFGFGALLLSIVPMLLWFYNARGSLGM